MKSSPEVVVCGIHDWKNPNIPDVLRQMKECGVTAIQIYTFWKDFEPNERGVFEWEHFDSQVKLIQAAGLKYVPFILIGPKYAAPEWWLNSPRHVGLVCLEHGKESPIDSVWNPELRVEIDRVLKAFAEHYLPWNVLESIQPGICGDYGESIMPVLGNWPGDYHTHRGYWMGGADAAESLREWLAKKYGGVNQLNEIWRSRYSSMAEVKPFLPHKAPSRTALFDQLDWYKDSMTDFVDFWMASCRRHFPDTPVYMCTGGNEEPEHASLFSAQAKACAKHGGGLRLTNECNRFFDNFFLTAYTHSACNFYGAYLGLEPVGSLTPEGVTSRMFGSAVYGNRQIFYYYNNIFKQPDQNGGSIRDARSERFVEHLHLLKERKQECELAFFWPSYVGAFEGEGIPGGIREIVTHIRRNTIIMPVNDYMVLDGALEKYKLLIIPTQIFTRREVLIKISEWVKAGGKVFAVGQAFDLELEPVAEFDSLFGIMPDSEKTAGYTQYQTIDKRFPLSSEVEKLSHVMGWLHLHPDTVEIIKSEVVKGQSGTVKNGGSLLFMREYENGGAAIAYFGPKNLQADKQDLKAHTAIFPLLLKDIISAYTKSEHLTAAEGEAVRGVIDGKTYALTEDFEIKVI